MFARVLSGYLLAAAIRPTQPPPSQWQSPDDADDDAGAGEGGASLPVIQRRGLSRPAADPDVVAPPLAPDTNAITPGMLFDWQSDPQDRS